MTKEGVIMLNEIIAFLGRRGEFFYISVFMLVMFFCLSHFMAS